MQEPVLFARSVRRNICYGMEEEDGVAPGDVPSAADVERAARLANAHEFISAMPEGYDTVRRRYFNTPSWHSLTNMQQTCPGTAVEDRDFATTVLHAVMGT